MSGQGRPSTYTPEIAAEICRRLLDGETLKVLCRDPEMPPESTVRLWVLDVDGFAALYTRARLVGYLAMADDLQEIADDGTNDYVERERADGTKYMAFDAEHVQRSKLRVDTRKWLLSKALPKIYGDKLQVDSKTDLTEKTKQEVIEGVVRELTEAAAAKGKE